MLGQLISLHKVLEKLPTTPPLADPSGQAGAEAWRVKADPALFLWEALP